KSFIDFRFPLFRRVAKDYGKIRALVQIEAVQYFRVLPAFREDTSEWQRILKRHDVDYLILSNYFRDARTRDLCLYFWLRPEVWACLYADGRTLAFAWQGSPLGKLPQSEQVDFNRLAFGKDLPADEVVPDKIITPGLKPAGPWATYLVGEAPPSLDYHLAQMHFNHFADFSDRWRDFEFMQWRSHWC